MRFAALILLLLPPTLKSQAQTTAHPFDYPALPINGKTIHTFIPRNWTVLDTAYGDLNADKRSDVVLVLQYKDSVRIPKDYDTDGQTDDTVLTQPRMLAVLFRTATGYKLDEYNYTFIPNHDQENMDDPFQDILVKKGVLIIQVGIFMNAGGWGASNSSYKWQFRQGQFRLIGADSYNFNRSNMETDEYSFNFLTHKYRRAHTPGYESEEDTATKKTGATWHPTPPGPLKTFRTFPAPYTWEIKEDFSL